MQLAEKMRARLLQGQAGEAEEEGMGTKQEMQDWMLSVGIASPVTKESAGALYHQQLSRQVHFKFRFLPFIHYTLWASLWALCRWCVRCCILRLQRFSTSKVQIFILSSDYT